MQIDCRNLTLEFGRVKVFESLSFQADSGIWQVRGANGSGKTSLCRIIAGLLRPTSGTVAHSDGKKLERPDLLGKIGFSTPGMGLYDELTVAQNLRFFELTAKARVDDAFGVSRFSGKPFSELSSGWKQRLCILVAFLGDPDLLVLDEPEQHLDDDGMKTLKKLIESRKKLTIVSTNNPFGDWPILVSLGAK